MGAVTRSHLGLSPPAFSSATAMPSPTPSGSRFLHPLGDCGLRSAAPPMSHIRSQRRIGSGSFGTVGRGWCTIPACVSWETWRKMASALRCFRRPPLQATHAASASILFRAFVVCRLFSDFPQECKIAELLGDDLAAQNHGLRRRKGGRFS